jgi:N-acetylglucosamine kinase-like BadF-type ATPase
MPFYLAIDAGGTKTDYLLADETRELARVRSATIKRLRVDADTAARTLDEALAQLSALGGISLRDITRTCIGTAGESVPLVANWLREAFAARVSGDLLLLGDVEIALDAAFPGQPGILVLAGTGSNVAGRAPSGTITTAGGWGPALADQGSGHRIGSEALRATFLAIDEHDSRDTTTPPTTLLPAILEFWNLSSIDSLIEYANATPAPNVSRLTSLVLTAAQNGDPVAQSVLRHEGEELAHLVHLVILRLQRLAPAPNWVPPVVAFAGSIMENVTPLRDTLLASLHTHFPTLQALPGVVDPIAGALWRARQTPTT